MQNELSSSGRLALEQIADHVLWAGYMPAGGWTEDEWHPVEQGTSGSFRFYADYEGDMILEDTDYRSIFLDVNNRVHIQDNASMDMVVGDNIVSLQFNYYDGSGNLLSRPLSTDDMDAVRHINIKLQLQTECIRQF